MIKRLYTINTLIHIILLFLTFVALVLSLIVKDDITDRNNEDPTVRFYRLAEILSPPIPSLQGIIFACTIFFMYLHLREKRRNIAVYHDPQAGTHESDHLSFVTRNKERSWGSFALLVLVQWGFLGICYIFNLVFLNATIKEMNRLDLSLPEIQQFGQTLSMEKGVRAIDIISLIGFSGSLVIDGLIYKQLIFLSK